MLGGSRGAGPPFAALRAAEKVWAFFGFQWSKTALSELQIPGFWPNLDPKNSKKNHFPPTFFFSNFILIIFGLINRVGRKKKIEKVKSFPKKKKKKKKKK